MNVQDKQSLLQDLSGKHLTYFCAKFRYPLEIQELFCLDEDSWNKLNSESFQTLQTHLEAKGIHDHRSPFQIGKETALSWLIEELWAAYYSKHGYQVSLNGSDGGRDFTSISNTKSKPDLEVSKNGKKAFIEIAVNWGSFFQETNTQTLRLYKLQNLIKHDGFLLTTDLNQKRFFIAQAKDLFYQTKSFGFYGKKESSIDLNHAIFKPATKENPPLFLPVKWRNLPEKFFEV